MTPQEIQDRMEVCPWRERPTGNPYVCTRYFGTTVLCDGACSWVVDYPKLKELEEKKVVEAYMWNGRYYIGWNSYCAPEYIKKVEHLPYRKCRNVGCAMREKCLRFTDYQEGDKVMEGREVWGCEKCDLIIEKDNKEFYK